jgi:hypothetical protein
MTPLDLATSRLHHELELHGATANPTPTIQRMVRELAPPHQRRMLADTLLDLWAQWCAEEGHDDDYTA